MGLAVDWYGGVSITGGAYPGKAALLIQEVQDSQRLLLNEVQDILIVHKGDIGPVDLLALVLGLLHLEDVLVEVLLQLLVGQIDAELLKVVLIERLEPCRQSLITLSASVPPLSGR